MSGRIASVVLCLTVGLAPLALGSDRPLPWAYNAILCGACSLIVAGILMLPQPKAPPLRLGVVAPSLLLWCLALSWALLQVAPLPGSPLDHPDWSLLSGALGEDIPGRISVNPLETTASIVRLLTYCALFLCAFTLGRNPDNAALLLRSFVLFALLYAAYGLLRYAEVSAKILWFDTNPGSSLSSTFVNRNSAATYFGIATCASLSLVMRRGRHLLAAVSESYSPRVKFEALVNGLVGTFGFELVGFFLLLTTVFLTQSRAGILATLVALCVGLALHIWRLRVSSSGPLGVVIFGLVAASLYGVVEFSGAGIAERLMATDMESEVRLPVYRETLAAISDHAWLGTGLGTFADVYPLYRSGVDAEGLVWDTAHNDYLEVLLGLGIPAGGALLLGITLLGLRCLWGIFTRRRNSHYPMIGFMASLLVGLHALFDFSLQIQAVAMSFALLLALGVAQSVSDRG